MAPQGTGDATSPGPQAIDEVMPADAGVRPGRGVEVPAAALQYPVAVGFRPEGEIPEIARTCGSTWSVAGGCLAKCPPAIISQLDEVPSGAVRFPLFH